MMCIEKWLIGLKNVLWCLLAILIVTTISGCSIRKQQGVLLLSAGTYKVGRDVPNGEYRAVSGTKFGIQKVQSDEDEEGNMTVDTYFHKDSEGVREHTFWACDGENIGTDSDIELKLVTEVAHS